MRAQQDRTVLKPQRSKDRPKNFQSTEYRSGSPWPFGVRVVDQECRLRNDYLLLTYFLVSLSSR